MKLPRITVSGRTEMVHGVRDGRFAGATHAISITNTTALDPDNNAFPEALRRYTHLHLAMDDMVFARLGYTPPTLEHVERIVSFTRYEVAKHPAPWVLVHCSAGISRSPAAALILLCALTSRQEAVAHLRTQLTTPVMPNRMMLELMDTRSGFAPGSLLALWEGGGS